jgi:hypothetical protein
LQNCGDGLWRLDLEMSPGRYDYGFVVDGQRVDDPSITGRASGTHHCVLIVTAHQHGQDAAPLTEATNRE